MKRVKNLDEFLNEASFKLTKKSLYYFVDLNFNDDLRKEMITRYPHLENVEDIRQCLYMIKNNIIEVPICPYCKSVARYDFNDGFIIKSISHKSCKEPYILKINDYHDLFKIDIRNSDFNIFLRFGTDLNSIIEQFKTENPDFSIYSNQSLFSSIFWYLKEDNLKDIPICSYCNKYRCQSYLNETGNLLFREYCFDCVNSASAIKMQNVIREKYGVDNISQLQEVKDKKEETLLKNYGVRQIMHSDFLKEKIQLTTQLKYGVDNISQLQEIKDKKEETLLKNYGVRQLMHSDVIKGKIKDTLHIKYGVDNVSKLEEVKNKKRDSFIEHYGVDNIFKCSEFKDYLKKYNLEHYGVEHYSQTEMMKEVYKQSYQERVEFLKRFHIDVFCPVVGYNETYCLNELQSITSNKIHRNLRILKYFVDGYIYESNMIIEYDERGHFDEDDNYIQYDIDRQNFLLEFTRGQILRIKSNEWKNENSKGTIINYFKQICCDIALCDKNLLIDRVNVMLFLSRKETNELTF